MPWPKTMPSTSPIPTTHPRRPLKTNKGTHQTLEESRNRGISVRSITAELRGYSHAIYDFSETGTTINFDGNLHQYLSSDMALGCECLPDRHASRESQSFMNKTSWRQHRVFPVPQTVDSSGAVLCSLTPDPHIGLVSAPRRHYYEDIAATDRIYDGHIGHHSTDTTS